jgi:predicted ATPase/class 3 adenylate cyclase
MAAPRRGPELPTGTVTFLFTDIEGSTRLLQELGPDRFQGVQADHDAIVRAAIAEGAGVVVRTEGDAFVAAFSTAAEALRAAVSAQRRLDGTQVRVRMGLHTGQGRLGGTDYVGIDVHRAARVAAAAHGGQILLSETTKSLVDRDLPDGAAIRDLGLHRLKDIDQAEHLFDVVIEGHPSEFPPPVTLDARPNNLPRRLTSFVGRRQEIRTTAQLLSDHRLVTLTGAGGTGKTRLALEVSEELLPSFADGAFFVDLTPLSDPGQVCPAICEAVGIKEEPGSDLVDTLVERLSRRQLLLILDNFEHLLEEAPLVDRVLAGAPNVRALVTSRAPLGLYGEQELPVPPLAAPIDGASSDLESLSRIEAVALFVDRARASRPDFALTEANGAAVAETCTRLDGLPLAIELAASRIKVLSPDAILSRLRHSLDVLAAGARNIPERQRTLRGAIEWSYGLLDEPERRLFARLSVFVGGADLEAAETVANPDRELGHDLFDGLVSLVDNSLVRQTETEAGEPRFGMLETIREYARERCDLEWDGEATRRRHANHFLALAEASEPHLTGQDQVTWLDRLDRDHENIQTALRWAMDEGEADRGMRAAASVWRFWHLRGHVATGLAWLERLLGSPGGRTADRAKAEDAAGSLSYWRSNVPETERHYREALAIYRELGDRHGIARATYDLAFVPLLRGSGLEEGERLLSDAIALYQELGDADGVAKAKGDMGLILMLRGDYLGALPVLEDFLSLARRRGDSFSLSDGLIRVADAHRGLGDLDRARRGYLQALDVTERANTPGGVAAVLQLMASVDADRGDHQRAMRLYGAGMAIAESIGDTDVIVAPYEFADPVGDARKTIGDEATDRALAEGRAMSVEEALAYARSADG